MRAPPQQRHRLRDQRRRRQRCERIFAVAGRGQRRRERGDEEGGRRDPDVGSLDPAHSPRFVACSRCSSSTTLRIRQPLCLRRAAEAHSPAGRTENTPCARGDAAAASFTIGARTRQRFPKGHTHMTLTDPSAATARRHGCVPARGARLSKRYRPDGRLVVDRVSLQVRRGEWLAIMGPSGCGKSTLLQMLGGLTTPTQRHRASWPARRSASCSESRRARIRRRHVGYVFQRYNLIEELRVVDDVSLPLRLNGVPGRRARAEATRDVGQPGPCAPGQCAAGRAVRRRAAAGGDRPGARGPSRRGARRRADRRARQRLRTARDRPARRRLPPGPDDRHGDARRVGCRCRARRRPHGPTARCVPDDAQSWAAR